MLRSRLQHMTQNADVRGHAAIIEDLRAEFGHSISVLTGPDDYLRYNCVMYAVDIEQDDEYIDLAWRCPEEIHADLDFLRFLIQQRDIQERPQAANGLLAVYFDGGDLKHVGRMISQSRVVSKWGIGNLYEHPLMEVPSSYGDTVRFFSRTDRETVLDRFVEFARMRAVEFE